MMQDMIEKVLKNFVYHVNLLKMKHKSAVYSIVHCMYIAFFCLMKEYHHFHTDILFLFS